MKDTNNQYRSNINYFTRWDGFRSLGLGMLIAGFVCVWIPMGFAAYLLGFVGLFAGIGLFFFGSAGCSTEEEIKKEIAKRCEDFGFKFDEVETEHHFYHRVPKNAEVVEFKGFDFDGNVMIKRMKNGSYASNFYHYAKMMVLTDALYIKRQNFSLTSDLGYGDWLEIPFTDVNKIEIVRKTERKRLNKKQTAEIKICEIFITYDGDRVLHFPQSDDIYADEFAAKLRKQVGI